MKYCLKIQMKYDQIKHYVYQGIKYWKLEVLFPDVYPSKNNTTAKSTSLSLLLRNGCKVNGQVNNKKVYSRERIKKEFCSKGFWKSLKV